MLNNTNRLELNIGHIKRGFHDKYTIVKSLDSGRYGTVYMATLKNNTSVFTPHTTVAVKQLPAYRHDIPQYKNVLMLTNEITNMRKLRGENYIVNLLDVYDDDNIFHLIQEYCDGFKAKRMLNHTNDEHEVSQLVAHIAYALQKCHEAGICHSDVKPSNIMYSDIQRTYKLGDFGSSFRASPSSGSTSIKGTPWFFSMEKFSGNYGYNVDMWALGILTYVLLYNAYPFMDDTQVFKKEHKINDIFNSMLLKRIFWHNTATPSDVAKDFIERALDFDQNTRLTAAEAIWHPFLKHHTLNIWSSADI